MIIFKLLVALKKRAPHFFSKIIMNILKRL